eukprot:CAMPEP_0171279982 /NCGR_PEP_ID=MMETSP0790-20130122/65663_1 /TAXON_ID=2925 /ORGANISM="Alexandrium catenella, Strain OF101" /LENGTH=290 /DNA_ID=CAMNT_0011749183 /DNA_START=61 /DNA_END=929 /DNA_ORIENTATION=+
MAIKPAHSRENPLEATFLLLRGLRGEIHELREQLAEERRARICENKSFAVQLQDLRGAELQHHSEMLAMLEELRAEKTARIDRLEDFIENALKEKAVRFENIEAKVEVEITERKAVIQALNKRLGAEAAQWRVRSEKQDREVKENRRIADLAASGARHRHDELRLEVERIASLLRENTMASGPVQALSAARHRGEHGAPHHGVPDGQPFAQNGNALAAPGEHRRGRQGPLPQWPRRALGRAARLSGAASRACPGACPGCPACTTPAPYEAGWLQLAVPHRPCKRTGKCGD